MDSPLDNIEDFETLDFRYPHQFQWRWLSIWSRSTVISGSDAILNHTWDSRSDSQQNCKSRYHSHPVLDPQAIAHLLCVRVRHWKRPCHWHCLGWLPILIHLAGFALADSSVKRVPLFRSFENGPRM
jgi:hypothetical protein